MEGIETIQKASYVLVKLTGIHQPGRNDLNSSPTMMKSPLTSKSSPIAPSATINCSSDKSQARIMGELTQLRKDKKLTKIALNDLVRSHHRCLLPLVKALAVTSSRTWESFSFVDAFELAQFDAWQELRDDMIYDYEQMSYEMDDASANFLHVMSWQAHVRIESGTPIQDIVAFLRRVQNDEEVYQVTFGGALEDTFEALVPDVIASLVDKQTLVLEKDIVVQVACGWLEEDSDWMEILDDCVTRLKERLPVSYQNLKKGGDASTASILSWSSSKGSLSNLSLKSCETSYAGFASFYNESFFEASQRDGANLSPTIRKTTHTRGKPLVYGENALDSLGGSLLLDDSTDHLSLPQNTDANVQVHKVPKAA